MKLFRILMVAAMAMITSTSVQAGVVISNMGNSGTLNNGSNTNDDIVSDGLRATGFTTGSSDQRINWVSMIAQYDTGSPLKSVSVYYDNAGSPGRLLGSSNATTVAGKGVYQFFFSGPQLLANTKYWVVPDTGLSWYLPNSGAAPTERNGSGFTYAGMIESSGGLGGPWTSATFHSTFALDSIFVPEPALTSLLCLSGIALIRRRMKK
jgi:hypothetical protein